jgi:hypothetical protein
MGDAHVKITIIEIVYLGTDKKSIDPTQLTFEGTA